MIFEEYFEDISKVKIEFNGEIMKLSDYNEFSTIPKINNNIQEYVNLKLYYEDELAGEIEGYILKLDSMYDEYSVSIYEDDIYWVLDDIWDDLGTLFNNIVEVGYSINEKYFLIKNIKSTLLFKDELVEDFILNTIQHFISTFLNINIDYLVLMADTSKLALSKEKFKVNVYDGIKTSFLKMIEGVKNAGKEVKMQNASFIAKKYDFYKIETNNKKTKIWIKDIDY